MQEEDNSVKDKASTKDKIIKWLQYDTQINENIKKMKLLKKAKKDLTDELTNIMRDSNTDLFNIKNVGQIIYSKRESKKGINKKYLNDILNNYYNTNPSIANELCNYILENRETVIRENIKFKKSEA
jgi:uncharacterized protein (UPF0335 family)